MALASTDSSEVLAAQIEDGAQSAPKKEAPVGDAAAAMLAAILVPDDHSATARMLTRGVGWFVAAPALLVGRTAPPLLEPPLD